MSEPKLINKEEYISKLRNWLNTRKQKMRQNVAMMATDGNGELRTGIRSAIRKQGGEPSRLSFHFPRHGVFFAYGVGRGYIRQGGKVVRGRNTSNSDKIKAIQSNRAIGDKIEFEHGPIKRKPKNFFDREIEGQPLEQLGDIVNEYRGDELLLNAKRILINKK